MPSTKTVCVTTFAQEVYVPPRLQIPLIKSGQSVSKLSPIVLSREDLTSAETFSYAKKTNNEQPNVATANGKLYSYMGQTKSRATIQKRQDGLN